MMSVNSAVFYNSGKFSALLSMSPFVLMRAALEQRLDI